MKSDISTDRGVRYTDRPGRFPRVAAKAIMPDSSPVQRDVRAQIRGATSHTAFVFISTGYNCRSTFPPLLLRDDPRIQQFLNFVTGSMGMNATSLSDFGTSHV